MHNPLITYGRDADSAIRVNLESVVITLGELGIPEWTINSISIYIDPKSRLLNYGTHYTRWLERLRFYFAGIDLRNAPGNIIRLSTVVRGKVRTSEQLNRTFVHEAEHLAQHERHDKKVLIGHGLIYGLVLSGAIGAYELSNRNILILILGAIIGYEIGYMLAPHEIQARRRARQVTSTPIHRRSD